MCQKRESKQNFLSENLIIKRKSIKNEHNKKSNLINEKEISIRLKGLKKQIDENQLNKLGYNEEQEKALIKLISKPDGAIIMSGKNIDGMSSKIETTPFDKSSEKVILNTLNGEIYYYTPNDFEKEQKKFLKTHNILWSKTRDGMSDKK